MPSLGRGRAHTQYTRTSGGAGLGRARRAHRPADARGQAPREPAGWPAGGEAASGLTSGWSRARGRRAGASSEEVEVEDDDEE
eukprot:4124535-Heterocapsa_arctica.AAC.1